MGVNRRPGEVQWQLYRWGSSELLFPVFAQGFQTLPLKSAPLPEGKLAFLESQLW